MAKTNIPKTKFQEREQKFFEDAGGGLEIYSIADFLTAFDVTISYGLLDDFLRPLARAIFDRKEVLDGREVVKQPPILQSVPTQDTLQVDGAISNSKIAPTLNTPPKKTRKTKTQSVSTANSVQGSQTKYSLKPKAFVPVPLTQRVYPIGIPADETKHFEYQGKWFNKSDFKKHSFVLNKNAPASLKGLTIAVTGVAKKVQAILLDDSPDPKHHIDYEHQTPFYLNKDILEEWLAL